MTLQFFTKLFHSIPHFTFSLKKAQPLFALDLKGDYIQSLLVLLVIALLIGALLLLTIIITWICQCCTQRDPAVKSRRHVQQISTVLFVISIICFFALGISLFANEHINRGVTSSVAGLGYVTDNFHLAYLQCNTLNDTFINATGHLRELSGKINADERIKDKEQLTSTLSEIVTKVSLLSVKLDDVTKILSNVVFLDQAKQFGGTAEFERWALLVTLLSIMLIVLFVGVIAFCRQSKKGAVMFSGLGFAIFIVGWLLLAIVFPIAVSWADFCLEGGTFVKSKLSSGMIETLNFYETCETLQSHDNTPAIMKLNEITVGLSEVQKQTSNVDLTLHKIFNDTEHENTSLVLDDFTRSFKSAGALDNQVACYRFHNDVNGMKHGFCESGMFGSALIVISLLVLEFFMFVLLLIVSKSWYLFKKLPSDYVEVDDEDPFFPRGNDSTIPVDIYGTHVYNPRTRYANSLDRTEPSTGTTIVAGMPNGSTSTQPSASTALLTGEGDWQRATAPPSNPALFSTPPAVGTNSMARSTYTARNDDASRYRNYQEQFDV